MYKLTNNEMIIRVEDNAYIPNDPDNRDRVAYDEWRAAGGVPQPRDPEPVVVEPTPAEKLAASGLTVDELKALLGLK